MLRRLYHEQPETFAFTPANQAWAEAQITKFPEGRQASAIIPLLWRAQEQEGWLSKPAIEAVADMLDLAYIRALEVATFYFMFQLQPVGSVAHIQVCGTTSCMICGAEDLIAVCKEKIAANPHDLSPDGKFSWEEVECLGACANAPMAQIGKDYYEDLTAEGFAALLDAFAAGQVPTPGPQNGRYAAEPLGGLTSLTGYAEGRAEHNVSAGLATQFGDTVKRIDGSEVPLLTPWNGNANSGTPTPANAETPPPAAPSTAPPKAAPEAPSATAAEPETAPVVKPSQALPGQADLAARKGNWSYKPQDTAAPKTTPAPKPAPAAKSAPAPKPAAEPASEAGTRPEALAGPRDGKADDLKKIKGIGPKLETLCNTLGFYHFDQIARWTEAEIAWVDQNLEGFKGRVTRDKWVNQARILAEGGETEFSKRAKY